MQNSTKQNQIKIMCYLKRFEMSKSAAQLLYGPVLVCGSIRVNEIDESTVMLSCACMPNWQLLKESDARWQELWQLNQVFSLGSVRLCQDIMLSKLLMRKPCGTNDLNSCTAENFQLVLDY